jgi:phytoene dehydrogenase-like protein
LQGKRATGVQAITGEWFPARVVVSGLDVVPTYRHLLPPGTPAPERTLRQERSSSAIIFYWGIRGSFPQLHLHNIFFSAQYAREFQQIFSERTTPSDPTLYVNITSKCTPTDAPEGHENWFILVNAPADTGQDWPAQRARAREATLRTLSNTLGCDVEPLIAEEDYLDPPRIAARTGSYQGALYGTASNNRFAAFLRHPHFSRRIPNLYFVGGSVHPGGGVPLCLASAELVDALVHEDTRP